jgi:hypothetical protein
MLASVLLEHNIVDVAQMQQMRQQQAGGPGANDGDLGAIHDCLASAWLPG